MVDANDDTDDENGVDEPHSLVGQHRSHAAGVRRTQRPRGPFHGRFPRVASIPPWTTEPHSGTVQGDEPHSVLARRMPRIIRRGLFSDVLTHSPPIARAAPIPPWTMEPHLGPGSMRSIGGTVQGWSRDCARCPDPSLGHGSLWRTTTLLLFISSLIVMLILIMSSTYRHGAIRNISAPCRQHNHHHHK